MDDQWRDESAPPPTGHNRGPVFDVEKLEKLSRDVVGFLTETTEWCDVERIESQADADRLADYAAAVSEMFDRVEALRKAEKQPHLDATREVDDAFRPLKERLEARKANAKRVNADWLKRERDRIKAERAEEARRARAEADAAKRAAEAAGPLSGVEAQRAERAARQAEKAAQEPVKVKAQGHGRAVSLRTRKRARIKSPLKAFLEFLDHPEVIEVLEKLATAEFKAGREPKGFEFLTEEYAA